jgi:hypothetical protein
MHYVFAIVTAALLGACVKPKSKDPVPTAEFLELRDLGQTKYGDTATIVLFYTDGDGDLFSESSTQAHSSSIVTPYFYNETTNKFEAYFDSDPKVNDTIRIGHAIFQPDNGYYKGKSIKGELYIPLTQIRRDESVTQIKFRGWLVDMKKHTSNVYSSPAYSINF